MSLASRTSRMKRAIHPCFFLLVHARHRLIQNEQLRLGCERARQLDVLLQAQRHHVDGLVPET